jgi:hypothetical protein
VGKGGSYIVEAWERWRQSFEEVCETVVGKAKVEKNNKKINDKEISELIKKRREWWKVWIG